MSTFAENIVPQLDSCDAQGPVKMISCSLPKGHAGQHEAHKDDGVIATWPNERRDRPSSELKGGQHDVLGPTNRTEAKMTAGDVLSLHLIKSAGISPEALPTVNPNANIPPAFPKGRWS